MCSFPRAASFGLCHYLNDIGFGGHVFIPEGVVAVKHGTFSDNISISEITIPSSMKKIPQVLVLRASCFLST